MGHSRRCRTRATRIASSTQYWAARDPIALYVARLQADGIVRPDDLERFKREAEAIVEAEARAVIDAPWPEPTQAGVGVFANEPPRKHVEVLDPEVRLNRRARRERSAGFNSASSAVSAVRRGQVEPSPPFDPKGKHVPRRRHARRRRCAARRSARVRLRRRRRRQLRQCVPAAAAAPQGVRRSA